MGGVVTKVWQQVRDDTIGTITAPLEGIKKVANGGTLGQGIGTAAKTAFGPGVKLIKGTVGEIKGSPDQPQTIVAEDPAAVADKAKKEKERAKRQAEINILTDRPGRGGTVLTDQYTYNV